MLPRNARVTPPKVLHIVETMGRGATESLLLQMLAHARATSVSIYWTFYCTLPEAGLHATQAVELGARVITSPSPIGSKTEFMSALRRELKRGRYDVLHAHHDLISGLYLWAAAGLPLRRVVHVHNAGEAVLTDHPVKRLLFSAVLRATCLALSDRIAAVSNHALETFLAGRPRRRERDLVLYSGVDGSTFAGPNPDRRAFRTALSLDENAAILLFAGRMVPEKNPSFVVDVLHSLHSMNRDTVAVFAGEGPEEAAVVAQAERLGVVRQIRLLGWRDDLPSVLQCADWFILPSPEEVMEGFGLAVVEAQLAGLRLLLSRGIADDPLLPHAKFRRLALAEGPEAWAKAALELMEGSAPSLSDAIADLAASPMNLDIALANLLEIYA